MAGREFRRLVEDVESLADRELRAASALGIGLAGISSRGAAVLDEQNGSIARSLDELRRWARVLALVGDPPFASDGRRFGLFPATDPTKAYERRWAEAQRPLEETVARLHDAVAQLRADNAAVAEVQLSFDMQIGTLTGYAELAEQLDQRLSVLIETLKLGDPAKAEVLKRDLLFEVRQRRQEILTQLTVAIQAHAALRIIGENNLRLIDAITSATTGTLGVLQTAAAVRQALEVRRRLQTGLQAKSTEDRGAGPQIPQAAALQQAWSEVGETLNQVERLRRQVTESAAMLVRSELR